MKTTIKLHMRAQELFKIMKDSLIQEVENANLKHFDPKQIGKGFSYTKKSKNRNVQVRIDAWKENQEYKATFTSGKDAIQITYLIREIDAQTIEVTYIHDVLNAPKLTQRWMEKKALKQAERMLKAVESSAIQR
ncbi:DUF3284 domain-containing protein [Dubosiella newyorkensis]|uniref:DUF3284 domain-containing protein n=1 Tax=Dubosiella newyorkensis TaxID=1862672 RepID=A0A1U7NPV6_9FIRM|nr:DUF3284 domain-containing protein [Dubosiella newyorkensis]OLU47640.1 hypothetical protein BO225_02000 [Dubosiella newyorkensis]